MKTFALDLASHHGCIACCDGGACTLSAVDHRIGDDELLPLVEAVVARGGWTMQQIERVACVTGPGGFTSLRVAVTLANTIAAELGVPRAGLHLSDLWKARCTQADMLWLHSTKKTELFVRGFGAHAALWPEPVLLPLAEVVAQCPHGAYWCGELIPEHQTALQEYALVQATATPVESILPNMVQSLLYSSHPLEPWYGRGW